jgi:DNA invertase Pin-like site-specific DNA recombinase
MKAILIARVSTEEQKEAGNSLPAQVARLEKYCHNKGFEIAKIFSFDESAYKNQRDEFDRILDFVIGQKSKVAVCCDKVDRLSRNMFDKRVSVLYEKALLDQIELHFVSDGQTINSRISATEKFQFGISLGLAKYYSDAISDNVKRANEQKLRKGEWTSKAPYGYKNITKEDGKKDVIVVDTRLSQLQDAEDSYYITAKYILEISSRAYDLFISSEVEDRRLLVKLILSNLKISGEKLVYDAHKPFDLILNCSDRTMWRPQTDSNRCSCRERAVS